MELFDWLTALYEIWKNLDQDIIYHSSVTGMGELLKTGCTTCFDHHYVFPGGNSDALLDAQFSAARDLKVRLHTHLCETIDEENYVLEKYGKRPLAYMEDMDWVGNDIWYAHGIHFNDEELNLLAQTGTGVAHCPISNMKLSSGVCRIPDMLKLNVPVGLAVDGSASNDGSNLLEELRVAFLLHRLNSSKLAPSSYDVLKIATNGSAKVLGRDDIGSLAVGKAGDLFLIRRDRLDFVGADLDVKSMLGTVGFKGFVDYTVVNGKIVVKDGQLVGIDEEKAIREGKQAVTNYLNR